MEKFGHEHFQETNASSTFIKYIILSNKHNKKNEIVCGKFLPYCFINSSIKTTNYYMVKSFISYEVL